jgi:hypothetical protein
MGDSMTSNEPTDERNQPVGHAFAAGKAQDETVLGEVDHESVECGRIDVVVMAVSVGLGLLVDEIVFRHPTCFRQRVEYERNTVTDDLDARPLVVIIRERC